jgi:hypothetical protein
MFKKRMYLFKLYKVEKNKIDEFTKNFDKV